MLRISSSCRQKDYGDGGGSQPTYGCGKAVRLCSLLECIIRLHDIYVGSHPPGLAQCDLIVFLHLMDSIKLYLVGLHPQMRYIAPPLFTLIRSVLPSLRIDFEKLVSAEDDRNY